ncbi:DUF397 domain-containing protein [Nonomuraea sp. MTCD27]|uniref:DUF397 domain-containing protein n=1 Tax=Nonomuraea sp. MTCD27 TaxID=1676747 RepID=UPI0035C01F73
MADTTEKTAWRKSSFCNGAAACVEVSPLPDGGVAVRDSKLGDDSPVLRVPAADWTAFVEAVKYGLLGALGGLVMCRRVGENAWSVWLASDVETALDFTEGEMSSFWKGIQDDEFDLGTLSAGDGPGVNTASRVSDAAESASGASSAPA